MLLVLASFLVGCGEDKLIIIKDMDANTLYNKALILFKKEMPKADIRTDDPSRTLIVEDRKNKNFPGYIEMHFNINHADTELTVVLEEKDTLKTENLRLLFAGALENEIASVDVQVESLGVDGNVTSPNMKIRRRGFAVKTKKDALLDRNSDGWVDIKEIEYFKGKISLF